MGRITAGRNISSFKYESGTYGSVTGTAQWVGLVQNFVPDDTENVQSIRYHGTTTRNVDLFTPGASDYGGEVTFYPQDFKMLMFAMGNIADTTTGSPAYYTHTITELAGCTQAPMTSGTKHPFTSFSFESSQFCISGQSLIRTYNGCVADSFTLAKDDNSSPLSCGVSFIAQNMTHGSIAPTFGEPTESTRRPYAPFDSIIHLPSGTKIDAKTWSFSLNNNFDRDGAHVANGSRVITSPSPTERGYEFSVTIDAESTEATRLYSAYKSGGNLTLNAALELRNYGVAASGVTFITMSGAAVTGFDAPNPVEGINEWNITLVPKVCDAVVQDATELYKAW